MYKKKNNRNEPRVHYQPRNQLEVGRVIREPPEREEQIAQYEPYDEGIAEERINDDHPDNVHDNDDEDYEYEPVYIPGLNVNEYFVMGLNRAYRANPPNIY